MNPAAFYPTATDYLRFLPELILTIGGVLLLVLEALTGDHKDKSKLGYLAAAIVVGAMFAVPVALANPGASFNGMIVSDGFAAFFRMVTLLVGLFTLLCSTSYLSRRKSQHGRVLPPRSVLARRPGIMAASNELIMVFLGLEIASISSYVLAGFLRDDKRGSESALKYFLLGSFATAFLLYGISWIYGVTGVTNLTAIRAPRWPPVPRRRPWWSPPPRSCSSVWPSRSPPLPSRFGRRTSTRALPPRSAAFSRPAPRPPPSPSLLRIFQTSFDSLSSRYEPVLWILALGTMFIGNFSALWQSNVKRMLAYSSIAHAGDVLVAVTTNSNVGTAAAMFYLAAYALMNYGAFAAITHLAGRNETHVTIDDLRGLAARQPVLAALLTVCLLSLTGVPLMARFFRQVLHLQSGHR
jgi:NADH-quinone oxidoreductase subunit N